MAWRPQNRWQIVDHGSKRLALWLSIPFVFAMLLGPALHAFVEPCGCCDDRTPREIVTSEQNGVAAEAHSHCCGPETGVVATSERAEENDSDSPRQPHDSENCVVCHLLAQAVQKTCITEIEGLTIPVVQLIPCDVTSAETGFSPEPISRGPPALV